MSPITELRPAVGTSDEPRGPGIAVHLAVLAISAIAAFLAYSLLS